MATHQYIDINLETFDDYQLHVMIERGKYVEEAKKEWEKRHGLDYPYKKNIKGEKGCIR